jgi:hypothetical protein
MSHDDDGDTGSADADADADEAIEYRRRTYTTVPTVSEGASVEPISPFYGEDHTPGPINSFYGDCHSSMGC